MCASAMISLDGWKVRRLGEWIVGEFDQLTLVCLLMAGCRRCAKVPRCNCDGITRGESGHAPRTHV